MLTNNGRCHSSLVLNYVMRSTDLPQSLRNNYTCYLTSALGISRPSISKSKKLLENLMKIQIISTKPPQLVNKLTKQKSRQQNNVEK